MEGYVVQEIQTRHRHVEAMAANQASKVGTIFVSGVEIDRFRVDGRDSLFYSKVGEK